VREDVCDPASERVAAIAAVALLKPRRVVAHGCPHPMKREEADEILHALVIEDAPRRRSSSLAIFRETLSSRSPPKPCCSRTCSDVPTHGVSIGGAACSVRCNVARRLARSGPFDPDLGSDTCSAAFGSQAGDG
jgi:hypothetical protein